jgi:hypothetical protein
MEFLKTYVYDHRIARTIKEEYPNNVEWSIEEVKPEVNSPNCKYKLSFKINNKKYYVKTISYTGSINPDIKQYDINSIEGFITDVEKELPNINFSITFNTKDKIVINKEKTQEEVDGFLKMKLPEHNELPNPKPKKLRL